MIEFTSPVSGQQLHPKNDFLNSNSGETFPIVKGIPRFVSSDNYTRAFGLQWNTHTLTQLDSHTKTNISKTRLERCLGRPLSSLENLNILEAGCGAGRFTELLVKSKANVHSMDLSLAVEANKNNIGAAPNYLVAQADIRKIPFPDESFDIVMCLGVLQHTPSPEESIQALWKKVKPGGSLVIDHYMFKKELLRRPDLIYRFFLKRLPPKISMKAVNIIVDFFFPIHWAVQNNRLGLLVLGRFSPCLVYFKEFPELTRTQHYELTKLDTYDHLTDYFKHFRNAKQLTKTLSSLGAKDIVAVENIGNGVELHCKKP